MLKRNRRAFDIAHVQVHVHVRVRAILTIVVVQDKYGVREGGGGGQRKT